MKQSFLFLITALFLFNCDEEKREILAITQDFCSSIHETKSSGLSSKLDSLQEIMKTKTGVYTLEDGDGAMVARAWLCENAEQSIDIQYFIFSVDNVGLIAADYLVRAADRGVKVRIIVDDVMIEADGEKLLTLDAHPNIEIKIYNPGTNIGKNLLQKINAYKTTFVAANQRMHNKTFTIDGKVVITGGRNIADEYFDYDHEYNFRDRDVLLIGGAVKDVQASFNQFWENKICQPVKALLDSSLIAGNSATPYEALHQYACDSNNFWPQVRSKIKSVPMIFDRICASGQLQWVDSVNFVSDIPGKNDGSKGMEGGGNTTTALMELVKQAKKSIVIQSPYLITTEKGRQLFFEAKQRGVELKIMTNSLASTDNLEAFSGYQRDRLLLLATGIRIFEYRPDAAIRYSIMTGALQKKIDFKPVFGLHAKTMVIDEKIAVIGTFNLDPRSANLNTECITIIHSEAVAKGVLKGIEEELKPENSWETTAIYNPDAEAGLKKNIKLKPMKVIPKGIL